MKQRHFLITGLVVVLSLIMGFWSIAMAQSAGEVEYVLDELLVKFKPEVTEETIASIQTQLDLKVIRLFKRIGVYHLQITSGLRVPEVITQLRQYPAVEYAEPNYLQYLDLTPNDPRYPEMWGLNNTGQTGGTPDADINAPQAWNFTTGSPSMVVAVIDSGMDLNHEDLRANRWTNPGEIAGNGIDDDGNGFIDDVHGWDFWDNDNDPTDTSPACGGHGTHTAGTVGAVGNNGIGVTGVNWPVQLMTLRAFGAFLGFLCTARTADIIAAIEYYTNFGVRVSNNSYGGTQFSQAQQDAIRASHSVFVAAAGNDGVNNDVQPHFPASYPLDNIIAVAATDDDDQMASFSNFGQMSVDIGAPGVSILSTLPGNAYGLLDGTSMATPHVAGVAALLLADDPTLTNNEVKWRILKSVDPIGLPVLTGGRLNANRAFQLQSEVTIEVTPLGSTNINPGDSVPYEVTITNLSTSSKTVTAQTFVRHPDGTETPFEGPLTFPLTGGETITRSFTETVPSFLPPSHFGLHHLVGRVFTAGFADFDEDEVIYDLAP